MSRFISCYFPTGQWHYGPRIGDREKANYESMLCPQIGAEMLNPVYIKDAYGNPYTQKNVNDWIVCGRRGWNLIVLNLFGSFTHYFLELYSLKGVLHQINATGVLVSLSFLSNTIELSHSAPRWMGATIGSLTKIPRNASLWRSLTDSKRREIARKKQLPPGIETAPRPQTCRHCSTCVRTTTRRPICGGTRKRASSTIPK